jgi:hypothetical protein
MSERAVAIIVACTDTPASRNPHETLAQIGKSVPDVTAADLREAADFAKSIQKRLRGLWWRIEQKRAADELKQQLKQQFRDQYARPGVRARERSF